MSNCVSPFYIARQKDECGSAQGVSHCWDTWSRGTNASGFQHVDIVKTTGFLSFKLTAVVNMVPGY